MYDPAFGVNNFSFRPLDGESFSKQFMQRILPKYLQRFRPLDGESFSKLDCVRGSIPRKKCFRPLDGESFSKLEMMAMITELDNIAFPSPRRGIIF